MKNLILLVVSTISFSTYAAELYECNGFDIEEYSVAINGDTGLAAFFDNSYVSYMQLTSTMSLESNPPQTLMTFNGKDEGRAGTLQLLFNQTRLKASLASISPDGRAESLGEVDCAAVPLTWDDKINN